MNLRPRQRLAHEPIRFTTHCEVIDGPDVEVEFVYHPSFPVAVQMTVHQPSGPVVWEFERDMILTALIYGGAGVLDIGMAKLNEDDLLFTFVSEHGRGQLIAPLSLVRNFHDATLRACDHERTARWSETWARGAAEHLRATA